MAQDFTIRKSNAGDLPQLADLRWRLQTDDEPVVDGAARKRFLDAFVSLSQQRDERDLVHWVAADGDKLLAAMSVVIVRKVSSPRDLNGRWGYLTNVYALPEVRNQGIGGSLLAAIKTWANDEGLELLTVWPSERAYPFYERAGFARLPDPLVLSLERPAPMTDDR
ncbi:MAG: GNAT family N-acetyltransferase [Caulobacteraceae bacterium]